MRITSFADTKINLFYTQQWTTTQKIINIKFIIAAASYSVCLSIGLDPVLFPDKIIPWMHGFLINTHLYNETRKLRFPTLEIEEEPVQVTPSQPLQNESLTFEEWVLFQY